jgi:NAD(P)H-dependent FMN reductase
MKIAIISASPRISAGSVSGFIAEVAAKRFADSGIIAERIDVRNCMTNKGCDQAFAMMNGADALMFIFPLYFFCVPGLLMRFLQDYADANPGTSKAIYAVVNCGFPEPKINAEALRVIARFAAHTGNHYRFGAAFGSGGMLHDAQNTPFIKKAMKAFDKTISLMAEDMQQKERSLSQDTYISIRFPRIAYVWMGNRSWRQMAKRNGLSKEDLYRTPYAD